MPRREQTMPVVNAATQSPLEVQWRSREEGRLGYAGERATTSTFCFSSDPHTFRRLAHWIPRSPARRRHRSTTPGSTTMLHSGARGGYLLSLFVGARLMEDAPALRHTVDHDDPGVAPRPFADVEPTRQRKTCQRARFGHESARRSCEDVTKLTSFVDCVPN